MSESTLQQEIEARRPATEGTLRQMASVYIDSVDENGNVKVQLSGSLVQQPDVITADTVIAAGADIVLPMRTIASKRIAVGIRLRAARKYQVAMLCFAASDDINYIKEQIVVDSASVAAVLGAAQTDAFTNRLKLRVYNKDNQDMTVRLLSLTEVH